MIDAGQFLAGSVLPGTVARPPRRVAGHPQGRNEVEEPRLRGLTRHPPRWLSPHRPSCRAFDRRAFPQAPRAGEDDERTTRRGVESTAVVYPASVWRRQSPGHHGSRTPRATRGVGVGRRGCYRPSAVSVGSRRHVVRSSTPQSRRLVDHAAKATSRVQTAQTVRTSLLATASVALL